MAKLISAFNPDDSLANSLSGLAQSIFGGNVAQQEVYRQNAFSKQRENAAIPALADAVVAGNINEATRQGILSGQDPKFTGGYNQFRVVNQYGPESREATTATMAVPGANYGNTVAGTREDLGNKRTIAQMQADRQLAGIKYTADNTPINVLIDGKPQIVSRSAAIAGGMTPSQSFDVVRGNTAANMVPNMSPDDRNRFIGLDKNPSTLWVYQTPDGRQGTTADGHRDISNGAALPQGTRVMRLEGANTEGLTGNSTVNRQLAEADIATRTAVADIDQLIQGLRKPNADQAVGYIGTLANTFNNVRSQFEATARLVGGLSSDAEFQDPNLNSGAANAATEILRNPAIVQRGLAISLDHATLQSQIQSLAYTIAKAKDPGGRVSNDDIRRASSIIGATLQDPNVAVQVLEGLKGDLQRGYNIRQQVIQQHFPQSAPRPAAAPATAAPASAPSAPVDWQTYFNTGR